MFPVAARRAVLQLHTVVQLPALVSAHERTCMNIGEFLIF